MSKEEINIEAFHRLEGRVARLEREKSEVIEKLEIFQRIAAKANRDRPFYVGERKTPVRKFVDFDKDEMQFLTAIITKLLTYSPTSLPAGGEDRAVAVNNRLLSILSAWEDEAYANGEFF